MSAAEPVSQTMPFDKFWSWLEHHANCIVRVGTPELTLFDQEDFHWNLTREEDGVFVVQLVRGKVLIGEMVLLSSDITYVQFEQGEGEDFVFECVVETSKTREAAYIFVLTHSYEDNDPPNRRWTH